MRFEELKKLIVDERSRQDDFASANVDDYVAKLVDNADFVVAFHGGVCRGFVAYYCNNDITRVAYITLVLVIPECRGSGLGQSLVNYVLLQAKKKGFRKCQLEVYSGNEAALALYRKLGFNIIEHRSSKFLLEVGL